MRRNVAICVEYDGSSYFGWQKQPDRRTVQGEIEAMLTDFFDEEITVNGSGRTDAGVHALAQVANFNIDTAMPTANMKRAFNDSLMYRDFREGGVGSVAPVRIKWAKDVADGFHARFSARGKKYIYRIRTESDLSVFDRNYVYHVMQELDLDSMKRASAYLVGEHDFSAFMSAGAQPMDSYVREIFDINVECAFDDEIRISVTGSGFLYNMVRIITGTLVDIGKGKIPADEMRFILESRDRKNAGHTAPPQGLYLAEVYYGDSYGAARSQGSCTATEGMMQDV